MNETDSTIQGVNLNAIAAEMPAELLPHWVTGVVRQYAKCRGSRSDHEAMDLWMEAMETAVEAARLAQSRGEDVTAYIKRAVYCRLTDRHRRFSAKSARIVLDDSPVLITRPMRDFTIALKLISPIAQSVWRAYRRSNGTISDLARVYGTTDYKMRTMLFPKLKAEMGAALSHVRFIRRGGI